jgi:hypothetical protein
MDIDYASLSHDGTESEEEAVVFVLDYSIYVIIDEGPKKCVTCKYVQYIYIAQTYSNFLHSCQIQRTSQG